MAKSDWWSLITWFCVAYVFVGPTLVVLTITAHNWLLLVLSVLAYLLNLMLLSHAKKQW
ncbi:MAG: hypothetical protein ACRDHW_12830 [Ktedonobacteraceae bacterium]